MLAWNAKSFGAADRRSARARLAFVVVSVAALASLLLVLAESSAAQVAGQVSFGKGLLQNASSINPTSLQFGPDGRLYVAHQNGTIKAYVVQRNAANSYSVTSTETIDLIKNMPNRNDNGSLN